ncbi:MAG: hypothetical protein J6Y40_06605 [Bacteroidales bacterium]|nr:hypothetical protein [Bacteroidales bacterium]
MSIRRHISGFIAALMAVLLSGTVSHAQFNPNANAAGTMKSTIDNMVDTTEYEIDSTVRQFTIKRFVKSLAHKDSMTLSNTFFGAMVLPGTGQIYNRDYWKLPIVYGTLGGCIGGAVAFNQKWKKNGLNKDRETRNLFIWGAVASYWGQLMDVTVSYKSYEKPLPARASFYASLLPGLGQAYNGDYWHIPIYYAGFTISGYCWAFNQKQYKRYRKMYREYGEGTYTGHMTPENMVWFRDYYRRNRDYSVLSTALIYILNVIDANVFAHFSHFDISDDITFNVHPDVITPELPTTGLYTYDPAYSNAKVGFTVDITF